MEGAAIKIALDARLTAQMSVGMKAYAAELAARLPRIAPDLDFVTFTQGRNFGLREQVGLPLAIRRERVALTHFLSLYAPVFAPRPFVVTVHDLIHLRFPQYFKAKVAPYYSTIVRRLCGHAHRVITDDPRTVNDLQRFLGVNPEKCRVVALGAADVFFHSAAPFAGSRPYLLYVGNHRPHKDLPTLFAAWASLPASIAIDLRLTGPDDLQAMRASYTRANGSIIALGDVTDEELARYYAGAAALAHPALCEGFGLPMLEAMAAGCPVIACAEAVPQVLKSVALTFAPGDASEASRAIERVLGDEGLRRDLINQGRALAKPLTWDRCASETAAVYREVLEECKA